MSFKTEMQEMAVELIDEVFGTDGEISQTVTIMRPELSNIDVSSDTLYTNYESFTIKGVLGPWKQDSSKTLQSNRNTETDKVKTDDRRLTVAYTNLQFLPSEEVDTVQLTDGSIYLIISTSADAAQAVMSMQLRKLSGAQS